MAVQTYSGCACHARPDTGESRWKDLGGACSVGKENLGLDAEAAEVLEKDGNRVSIFGLHLLATAS